MRKVVVYRYVNGVVVDENNVVVKGNARVAVAKKLGLHEVPVVSGSVREVLIDPYTRDYVVFGSEQAALEFLDVSSVEELEELGMYLMEVSSE